MQVVFFCENGQIRVESMDHLWSNADVVNELSHTHRRKIMTNGMFQIEDFAGQDLLAREQMCQHNEKMMMDDLDEIQNDLNQLKYELSAKYPAGAKLITVYVDGCAVVGMLNYLGKTCTVLKLHWNGGKYNDGNRYQKIRVQRDCVASKSMRDIACA